jgi:hypothetical protein
MSLAINIATPEGIVLAADSRQTYRNQKGVVRIGSDSASKLFLVNSRVGVGITGLAFLPENGTMKNISKYIEQFRREVDTTKLSVRDLADKVFYLFNRKYNWEEQLTRLQEQIPVDLQHKGLELVKLQKEDYRIRFSFRSPDGRVQDAMASVELISLFIAGYNTDGSHEVYLANIPGEVKKIRDSTKTNMEYGANWIGQTDVVSRVIKGWDARIFNVKFMADTLVQLGQKQVEEQLGNLEYAINWGAMPLQDAINFCVLMIRTTSAIQRFSDGILADPGDIPGVGGPIDVLVLKPDESRWIRQKELSLDA